MSVKIDLLAPTVLFASLAIGQVWNTIRERRTGEVVWWAKHINVFGLVFIPIDYSDPTRMRRRHWENLILSVACVILAIFVGLKFLGI